MKVIKILSYIILIILVTAFMGAIALTAQNTVEPDLPPDPTIYYEAGVEIIDYRFTPPDTYELFYRTTFENGLTIKQWKVVTEKEFREYSEKRHVETNSGG